jgi:hypothetical protein
MLPARQCHDCGCCLPVTNVLVVDAIYLVSNPLIADASTNLLALSAVDVKLAECWPLANDLITGVDCLPPMS